MTNPPPASAADRLHARAIEDARSCLIANHREVWNALEFLGSHRLPVHQGSHSGPVQRGPSCPWYLSARTNNTRHPLIPNSAAGRHPRHLFVHPPAHCADDACCSGYLSACACCSGYLSACADPCPQGPQFTCPAVPLLLMVPVRPCRFLSLGATVYLSISASARARGQFTCPSVRPVLRGYSLPVQRCPCPGYLSARAVPLHPRGFQPEHPRGNRSPRPRRIRRPHPPLTACPGHHRPPLIPRN